MDIQTTLTTLLKDGLILVFNQDKLDVIKTAQAIEKAGVNSMEVTCRISRPAEKLARLRKEMPDFVAGMASLIDWPEILDVYNRTHCGTGFQPVQDTARMAVPHLQEAVDAGACFLVSAGGFRDESFARFAGQVALIPGCGSVTEILSQYAKGANLCKVFPAKQLGGPAFIKAIDPAIHKTISLVPMGGTNTTNIPDYIDVGVLILGGSFSMIDKAAMKQIVEQQDYDLLAKELTTVKKLIDQLRRDKYPDLDWASLEQITEVTGRSFNLV